MEMVAATVAAQGLIDSVVVSSFDLGALGSLRAANARIPAGWLTSRQPVERVASAAVDRGVAWLHPDRESVMVDPEAAVRIAHEHGLRIDVWTVNQPNDVRALAAAGVDAIITDTPDVAIAALREA
jgi:glycerophosphoryl diester phosphodiesterase